MTPRPPFEIGSWELGRDENRNYGFLVAGEAADGAAEEGDAVAGLEESVDVGGAGGGGISTTGRVPETGGIQRL